MDWIFILWTALIIEAFTIFMRFFFKISSKETWIRIMKHFGWKKVFHFHHGFFGLIVLAFGIYSGLIFWGNVGLGIFFSDVIHHLIVLWTVMGDPEFHVVYKNVKVLKKEEKMEQKNLKRFIRHVVHEVA